MTIIPAEDRAKVDALPGVPFNPVLLVRTGNVLLTFTTGWV